MIEKKVYINPFNCIVKGFFFHLLGQIVVAITNNQIMQAFVCLIGWIFIIKGFVALLNRHELRIPFRGIYKSLFVLYLLICVIMIIRGYMIDYNYQWISIYGLINYHFFSPYYILPYLMPLVVLIPYKYYDLSLFIRYSIIVSIISIIVLIIFYRQILNISLSLAKGFEGDYGFGSSFANIYIPFAFTVLCKRYIKNKIWIINSLALLLSLFINAIAARRGGTFIIATLFLFNIYFLIKVIRGWKKIFMCVIFFFILIIGLYLFQTSQQFSFIRERGVEDTRSGVDKALLSQMSDCELIFGKGLNGRYYYPLNLSEDYLNGWRYGSETGFYNLVLKGGYIMAILYIILLAYPALMGIFKSKNILCKAFGFYIILSLVELYPFGWLLFDMKFLIIWLGVSLCYNKSVRLLNDNQMYNYLFKFLS